MSTIIDELPVAVEPAAIRAWSEGRTIFFELHDARIIGFPADRFRILSLATEEQLARVQVEVNGYALRWNEMDEDITVPGIVAGVSNCHQNRIKVCTPASAHAPA